MAKVRIPVLAKVFIYEYSKQKRVDEIDISGEKALHLKYNA